MNRVVLKFGGTSVATRERWEAIAEIVRQHLADGEQVLLVTSAVAGVSNILEALPDEALKGAAEPSLQKLRQIHVELAAKMGVDLDGCGAGVFLAEAERVCTGAALLGEMNPRLRARLLSLGELMSTKLGAAFLTKIDLPTTWLDARELLPTDSQPSLREESRYLSANVAPDFDPKLVEVLKSAGEVALVQGFIARDPSGNTAVLGRGGSDTSAALFAARSGAARCEIWTDVPGMFTANPRDIPSARLIKQLSYDEAQEIASMGAKVLHPRSVDPVRRAKIPMVVKSSLRPELPGTRIGAYSGSEGPEVKALSVKTGVQLVSMETVGMWQQVGFLADAFAVFKAHGISIDLVSTSETNVTASLDLKANALDAGLMSRLLEDLKPICVPKLIGPVAAVSLLGHHIRGLLHRLGPALEVFEEQQVHLVSQAASDLNFTVVVDEDQAPRLVAAIHRQLIGPRAKEDKVLGPTWDEIFDPLSSKSREAGEDVEPPSERWWRRRADELLAVAAEGSPRYVYDLDTVARRARQLMALENVDRVLYAVKANPHPEILSCLAAEGLGLETVSPQEVARSKAALQGPERILFTPNFAPRADYEVALAQDVLLTLDNLHPLKAWPELFSGKELVLRLDPGQGRGHHAHVRTAGAESKFGVAEGQLEEAQALLQAAGATVVGLHAHVGSGVLDPKAWLGTASFLAKHSRRFPSVRFIDLGGGLGVPYRGDQRPLDFDRFDEALSQVKRAFPHLELWIEPGRFLVAEAGVLLCRVTQRKQKGDASWVGVDTGMNSLIRPALYGAYHHISNLSRPDAPLERVHVVGPICESGDTLGWSRRIASPQEGDVLLVQTAGAYGAVMASHYNLRAPAEELVLPRQGLDG